MRAARIALLWLPLLLPACRGRAQEPAAVGTAPTVRRLCEAALERTRQESRYDPPNARIDYPGGDVPADRGVCTDVVIRSYRQAFDLDLHVLVHEDMSTLFEAYPKSWGPSRPGG